MRTPAADGEFDLVLNRHGRLDLAELDRVLCSGGHFLTQQVGAGNDSEFNRALGLSDPEFTGGCSTAEDLASALAERGFDVRRAEHAAAPYTFLDIAGVVFQLLAVPWQVPGFSVERFDGPLRELDRHIRDSGGFTVHNQRYLVEAVKPGRTTCARP